MSPQDRKLVIARIRDVVVKAKPGTLYRAAGWGALAGITDAGATGSPGWQIARELVQALCAENLLEPVVGDDGVRSYRRVRLRGE